MCGIFAVLGFSEEPNKFRSKAVSLSKKLRHRGPDWSGCKMYKNNILVHERLAIVGVDSGAQPITNEDESILLTVNGEIYNHMTVRKQFKQKHNFKTNSDCEVILHLYKEFGTKCVAMLDGMFSFVLYDGRTNTYLAARDHVGITTLYQGWRKSDNSVWFASEMKSLNEDCDRIIAFPPGHYWSSVDGKHVRYYEPVWYGDQKAGLPRLEDEEKRISEEEEKKMLSEVKGALEKSVAMRLMAEVPYGVLLSGGLDSSLIAAIASRQMKRHDQDAEEDDDVRSSLSMSSGYPKLHSFSIGLAGSPDLAAARTVANFLKTIHHEMVFTTQEGIDAIEEVIYHLETYDVTTIRASTPMYLLSRKIKATGVKMVLSGEGSDEIYAGYLYFHNAPTAQSLHHECITRIQNLHTSDNLRANKSTMAWGLEARVPFLDKKFLDISMTRVPANYKLHGRPPYNTSIEKYVLRKAFDTPEDPYLPESVLWRQKEQFSDGVGYSWIDGLKEHAGEQVSDEQLANAGKRFEVDTPTTKEAYWYRVLFEKLFPQKACLESVVRWIPRRDWGCSEDPSGRAQTAHKSAYGKEVKANGLKRGGDGVGGDAKKSKK